MRARSPASRTGGRCRTANRWLGVSTNPPASWATASVPARVTWSSVTPLARSRSGSTSTWNCLSRWPHTATLATPGTLISLGRTVHRTTSVISIWLSVLDQTPIFSTRLVVDRGCRMTGGRATTGSRGVSKATRSCTICRTRMASLPVSSTSTTCDSPSTDFERTVFTPGRPFRASSMGTVTSDSTSSVERPGASVCTSTSGGANSGNTSSGAFWTAREPTTRRTTDRATTTTRRRTEVEMSQVSMGRSRRRGIRGERPA